MRKLLPFIFAILCVCAGCAKPEAQLVGKWQVDTTSLGTGNAATDSMAKEFAKSMTIEFKADKTFTMTMLFSFEGTYEVTGHTVTMKTTKMLGMDLSKMANKSDQSQNKTEQGTLSDDGKTLTLQSNGKPMKFVKAT